MEYEVVIGLETHVQLKTRSKMWCGCANLYGAQPNTQVCPVCLGMPGVLPVPNSEALRLTALTGFLLNSEVPRKAKFDRKNYFYPDSAKNYQLTQLDMPSTQGGYVEFEMGDELARVNITRAHLEEDVGKSTHFADYSGVDFNRAGVPLLEIITEPEISSAKMAFEYLNALKNILQYGGVSDCDMEKGQVRCDVNVSVRPAGQKELGAKIEIKNMNSFSGARRALEYEISRQIEFWRKAGRCVRKHGAGMMRLVLPTVCAPRRRRTITDIFPIRILCPTRQARNGARRFALVWWNCLWRASGVLLLITSFHREMLMFS